MIPRAAATICLVLLVYWPSLGAGFVWDDDAHILNNQAVTNPAGLSQIWTSADAVYYPLTSTVFWVQYRLWGSTPFPYHLFNILLHLANVFLLWGLLARLKIGVAWLAALLFALHPVHVESVAWITELKNLLCGFFILLSAHAYLRRDRNGYIASLLCFTLSLLAKPAAVMFPALLLLYEWRKQSPVDQKLFGRIAPFAAVALPAGLWTVWEQVFHSGARGEPWALAFGERIILAGKVIPFYLGKLIWPHPVSFIYDRWEINPADPAAYLGILFTVTLLGAVWMAFKRGIPAPFWAVVFFIITIFPFLGFMNIYFFRYTFVADHFLYLASIGPLVLLASRLAKPKALPYLIVPVLCLLTFSGTKRFHNSESLWRSTIASTQRPWLAHNNLGNILTQRLDHAQAARHYMKAIHYKPDFAEAHANLATTLTRAGRFAEAAEQQLTALRFEPDYAEAHNGLGIALSELGKTEEAVYHFREAVRIKPDNPIFRRNLSELVEGFEQV
ncbi:MAG: tetratricopeptide repeat protein [Candidatus Omnitrophota bacterium]|nr:tetratricopeptide repeat protein [Candidatus Omnitrophota bacterium]